MATLDQTIRLIFEGVDQTGAAIDSVTRGLGGVSSAVQGATAPLADFTTDILKFEAATVAAGVALVTYSAAVSQDFERAFREIATLIDVPLEGLEGFRDEILTFAQTSTQGLDEITAATYDTISAGVAWEDSLKAIGVAEKLAIAGNAELGDGLNALIPTLNAYGLGMEDAGRFSDILFTTVREGKTTLPELAASLSNVTTLAATAGVPFEEIGAAIATLTAGGAPTSKAITQITSALSAYIKPSSAAADLAESLGLEFNASSLASKGFAGSIQAAAQATGGSTEKMALLFGRVEGLSAALRISGTGADKMTASLDSMENATGNVDTAYGKMIGNLDTGASAGQVALVKLGDSFRDAFFNTKSSLTDITNAIANSLGGANFAGLLAQIQGFGDAIAATIAEVARNLPAALNAADLSGFESGISKVAAAFDRLFDGIDITTVDGLQAAIEKVGTAVDKLGSFTAATIDELKPFFELFGSFANSVIEADDGLFTFAGTIGGLLIATNTVLPVVDTLLLTFLAIGGTGGALAKGAAAIVAVGAAAKGAGVVLAGLASTAAGVATVGGALGFWAGSVLNEFDSVNEGARDLTDAIFGMEEEYDRALGDMVITAESLGIVRRSADTVGLGFEEAGRRLGKFELENKALITTLNTEQETIDRLTDSFADQGLVYDAATGEVKEFAGAIFSVATQTDIYNDALEKGKIITAQYTDETGKLVRVYKDVGGGAAEAKQSLGELLTGTLDSAQAFNQFAEDTGIAKDKILEFATELEKTKIETRAEIDISEIESKTEIAKAQIASIETIATAKIELNIAEVQANAQVATALIASIGEAATGTNENIRSVIDAISGLDKADELAFRKEQIFRKQLGIENDRAERQLTIQEELADAQINYYQESARRLRSGDALITINGDGLAPELEAFMFAVIRNVQLVVQQDQAGFLLGLPV